MAHQLLPSAPLLLSLRASLSQVPDHPPPGEEMESPARQPAGKVGSLGGKPVGEEASAEWELWGCFLETSSRPTASPSRG